MSVALYGLLCRGVRPAEHPGEIRVGIFRRGGIGDWAIFVTAMTMYAEMFPAPRHRITLYGDARYAPFRFLSSADFEFIAIDQKQWRRGVTHRTAFLREARRIGFDIWIDADVSRNKVGLLLAEAAAARHRYALGAEHVDGCASAQVCAIGLDRVAETPRRGEHEHSRVFRLARYVATNPARPELATPLPRTASPRPTSPDAGGQLVIFCGASAATRAWPLSRYAEVARQIHARHALTAVFLGDDRTAGIEVMMADVPYTDLRGRTTPKELVEQITQARLVLTNDSAGLHLAVLMGRPVVVAAAGSSYSRYCKYDDPNVAVVHRHDTSCFDCEGRCPYGLGTAGLFPCLDAIPAEQVTSACNAMLSADSR